MNIKNRSPVAGMLAIPIFHTRVAPVLDWCSRIQVFPADDPDTGKTEELVLAHLDPLERLKLLKDKGVRVIICGTLSHALLRCARQLGLTVIWGVAGEVTEVCRSYRCNQLDQPRFWLPGCRGLRRYQGRGLGRGRGRCRRLGISHSGSATTREKPLKPVWSCPACQVTVNIAENLSSSEPRCPNCGQTMIKGR